MADRVEFNGFSSGLQSITYYASLVDMGDLEVC